MSSTITRNRAGTSSGGGHAGGGHRVEQPASDSVLSRFLGGRSERSPWRLAAAAAATAEAAVHIPVIQEHLKEAPYIGIAFVLVTVAGFVLAQLLLNADTPAVWLSTAAISGLALAAFILSRTVGLPQIHDDIGNWSDPLGIVAIVSEAVMLITAIVQLRTHRARS